MDWIYTYEAVAAVESRNVLGMKQRTINYSREELGQADEYGCRYRHKSATLEPGAWSYDAIVNALVTAEYPRDKMDAVVNNYLADPTDPTAQAEMAEMQAWRAQAKSLAHELLGE